MRAAIPETEDDAPVGAHCDAPVTFQVPFERMQAIAGEIETLRAGGGVQQSQNFADFFNEIRPDEAGIVFLVEPLQALMVKALNRNDKDSLSLANVSTMACRLYISDKLRPASWKRVIRVIIPRFSVPAASQQYSGNR
jgi:hypothetical protein